MLLKIVAFMDDPHRRVKDLDDIRRLLTEYESDSERLFSDAVIDAALEDFGLASAFLLDLDLRALCTDEEEQVVDAFLAAMNEENPRWMLSFELEESAIMPRRMRKLNFSPSDEV